MKIVRTKKKTGTQTTLQIVSTIERALIWKMVRAWITVAISAKCWALCSPKNNSIHVNKIATISKTWRVATNDERALSALPSIYFLARWHSIPGQFYQNYTAVKQVTFSQRTVSNQLLIVSVNESPSQTKKTRVWFHKGHCVKQIILAYFFRSIPLTLFHKHKFSNSKITKQSKPLFHPCLQ